MGVNIFTPTCTVGTKKRVQLCRMHLLVLRWWKLLWFALVWAENAVFKRRTCSDV